MSEHNDNDEIILSDVDFHKVVEALHYQEIEHHDSIRGAQVHRLRKAIEPLLSDLLFALHDTRVIGPGQKWTVPMGLSCGMEADLVVRVRALGPDHDLEN
jgi:hypothetical protein